MSKATYMQSVEITRQLLALRSAVMELARLQMQDVAELTGHQTVDAQQSLEQCFMVLDGHISQMEETLVMMAEATGGQQPLP